MNNLLKTNLALTLILSAGFLAGCNNNPERASTNDREDTEMVSMKSDADIENRSADKSSVLARDQGAANNSEYSAQENNPSMDQDDNRYSQNRSDANGSANAYRMNAEDKTVLFEFDSANLTSEAKESLDTIANALEDQQTSVNSITIRGYADALGPDEYNEQLSESRAEAVRNYLRDKGVNADSWNVEGMGEDNPVATNDNPQGRSENRRVVIELSGADNSGLSSNYTPD